MNRENKDAEAILRSQVSEDDIYEAMKDVSGYLDITPGDLKEVYSHAYKHALERIRNSVKAADIMTRDVLTVLKEAPLGEVAELMARNGISGVPVVDAERHVLGIISEKDFSMNMGAHRINSLMGIIADCIKHQGCAAMTIRGKKAEDIMTAPVITVQANTAMGEIAALLAKNNINRVPVVDPNGCLKGIVSRADIVRISYGNPQ
jgi:CBS domain-containing membrane protein